MSEQNQSYRGELVGYLATDFAIKAGFPVDEEDQYPSNYSIKTYHSDEQIWMRVIDQDNPTERFFRLYTNGNVEIVDHWPKQKLKTTRFYLPDGELTTTALEDGRKIISKETENIGPEEYEHMRSEVKRLIEDALVASPKFDEKLVHPPVELKKPATHRP